jgi:putative ABC transport system permease protein
MIINYLKTALRNLWKDKTSFIINFLGLAVGMASCMLILIYVRDELSFNRQNKQIDQIYRVNFTINMNGVLTENANTPIPCGPAILSDIPQVSAAARLYQRSGNMQVISAGRTQDKRFQEQNVYFSDKSLFEIFSIRFIRGSAENNSNTVVITDEMAAKYFGEADPVGKTLLFDNKTSIRVCGVVKKMPANSDLQFDFLLPFETLYTVESPKIADYLRTNWTFNPATTYCLLRPGQDLSLLDRELKVLVNKYGDSRKSLYSLSLQPLIDIHLHAAGILGNPSKNSIIYIYIFSAIAVLILVIANINFINLSTARAFLRAREVGMRKVLGAGKKQLIVQFLGEALLLSFGAFLFALLLTQFSLPLLNLLTEKELNFSSWANYQVLILFGFIFIATGLLSGLYPAFFMTRFNPISALKGRLPGGVNKNLSGKVLLVTQFTISLVLIIGAVIIFRQLEFIRNKPLGFKKEEVVVLPIFGSGASSIDYQVDGPMRQRMNSFSNELTAFRKIESVTITSDLPGMSPFQGLVIPQGYKETDNLFIPWVSVDYNFIDAFKIPLVAGRNFSKLTGTDHLSAFILNESAVSKFGWKSPADALGKTMIRGPEQTGKKGLVIGVIRDYHFNTLDQPMQPLVLDVSASRFTSFAINIQADHVPSTIAFINEKWNAFFPERVFEYSFLDKDIDSLYKDKEHLSRIMEYFALIAILLCCTGLFSLASFLFLQRTREIGIRKVLGAGVPAILLLLSRDFLKLVLIAFLISFPVSWAVMHKWLEKFAYRISINWWVFALAGLGVTLIAMMTLGIQALRVALANPIKSLKEE